MESIRHSLFARFHSSDAKAHRENEILFSPPAHARSAWWGGVRGGGHFLSTPPTPAPLSSPGISRLPPPPPRAARGGEGLGVGGTFFLLPPPRLISLT